MTPQELIDRACPDIARIGSAFYFDPATLARGKELGLDGFRFYFLGRGGVLGDAEARVVESAFGYFAPDLVARVWNSARETMPPRDAGRAYLECARNHARTHFAGIDGLDAFCAAAEAVNGATDAASLALYAAVSAEPLCDDLPGRAGQLVVNLREYRGSAHLAAIRSLGLAPAVAHAIKRPDDVAMFGYEAPPSLTDADRAVYDRVEALTDAMVTPAYAVLDDEGAAALLRGLEAMTAALAG